MRMLVPDLFLYLPNASTQGTSIHEPDVPTQRKGTAEADNKTWAKHVGGDEEDAKTYRSLMTARRCSPMLSSWLLAAGGRVLSFCVGGRGESVRP